MVFMDSTVGSCIYLRNLFLKYLMPSRLLIKINCPQPEIIPPPTSKKQKNHPQEKKKEKTTTHWLKPCLGNSHLKPCNYWHCVLLILSDDNLSLSVRYRAVYVFLKVLLWYGNNYLVKARKTLVLSNSIRKLIMKSLESDVKECD